MNAPAFADAIELVMNDKSAKSGIGTLAERKLHAILKLYFEPNPAFHEVKIGKYYADICTGSEIIEIQTRNLGKLRAKLDDFLERMPVTVVFPVTHIKWLIWIDADTGEAADKRKSPKKGDAFEVFRELWKISAFLDHPNFNLCILLADMEEYRFRDGWSKDGKKGSTRAERIPVTLVEELWLREPCDYHVFLPEELTAEFTLKEYAKAVHHPPRLAREALTVLRKLGLVRQTGKRGREYLYCEGR